MKSFMWAVVVGFSMLVSSSLFAEVAATGVAAQANSGKAQVDSAASAGPGADEFVIADFNTGETNNNVDQQFGAWDKDPNDETQMSQMTFESDDALGDKLGYSLKLEYDVDSPNPAYNGFWMKLGTFDATTYNTVNFYIKGDTAAGFTKRIKIELKDSSKQPAAFILSGLTDTWQKISIPFEKFRKIKNWDALTEFVVVFDDINSNPKTGAIYIDHVTFSNE